MLIAGNYWVLIDSLDRQNLAMVPVGGIGSSEMLSLMSSHFREFLREADVFLRDHTADQQRCGLVVSAQQNIHRLFSKFSLKATAQFKDFKKRCQVGRHPVLFAASQCR
jgi:hypothetical protein